MSRLFLIAALTAAVTVPAHAQTGATAVPSPAAPAPALSAPEKQDPPEAALSDRADRDATGATLDGPALAVTLMGKTVRGPEGDQLGEVEDMLVDRNTGDIRALVMGTGGFLGLGRRQVEVPWTKAQYDPNADQVVIALNGEQISALPAFDPTRLDQDSVALGDSR
ncbi:MAG TPA: PRC-barrel domain-containing protein [Azospirillaceae bacterium]|nr:PRC-barrel domain-containing protein [Azospirillaceae bacterium]